MSYGKTCKALFNLQGIEIMQDVEQKDLLLKIKSDTIFKLNTTTKPLEVTIYV